MRLGIVLCKWPKSRPPGNIWIGKNQMVRIVEPWHKKRIQKAIDQEKKNIFYCMNPAATVEQERALYRLMDQEEDPKDEAFNSKKAYLESRKLAPLRLNGHYNILKGEGTWQKF